MVKPHFMGNLWIFMGVFRYYLNCLLIDVDWLFHGDLIIFDRGFHYQQYGDVVDKLDLVWI